MVPDNMTMKRALRLLCEGITTWHEADELANWIEAAFTETDKRERALREALEIIADPLKLRQCNILMPTWHSDGQEAAKIARRALGLEEQDERAKAAI